MTKPLRHVALLGVPEIKRKRAKVDKDSAEAVSQPSLPLERTYGSSSARTRQKKKRRRAKQVASQPATVHPLKQEQKTPAPSEERVQWTHQPPHAWAKDLSVFSRAFPTFPLSKCVFISPGGYARAVRLGSHFRDVTVMHVCEGSEASLSIKYTFDAPISPRDGCSEATPLTRRSHGLETAHALLNSHRQGAQVCLFLERAPKAEQLDLNTYRSSQAEQQLQDLLPSGVQVLLLGSFTIDKCQQVEQSLPGKTCAMLLDLHWCESQGQPWWSAPTSAQRDASSQSSHSDRAPLCSAVRRNIYPPLFLLPPPKPATSFSGSPVPTLFSSTICTVCSCAMARSHWKGWTCPNCSEDFPAPALMVRRDVYMGRMRVKYSGPRMDNGHCIVDLQAGVQCSPNIWSDGVKTVTYTAPLPNAARVSPFNDNSSQTTTQEISLIHHILASGVLATRADDLLEHLIKPDLPYLHASKAAGENINLFLSRISAFSADKAGVKAGLYAATALELGETPEVFLDVASYTEDTTLRFAGEGRKAINDAIFCLGAKTDIQPLDNVGVDGQLQLAHFGSDAHVTLTRKAGAALGAPLVGRSSKGEASTTGNASSHRPEVVATWQMDHGDVLLVPNCEVLSRGYELRVHAKLGMSVMALCRSLGPSLY